MAEKYEVDPNHEKLQAEETKGEADLKAYSADMDKAMDSIDTAEDKALGEIGEMGADGKWTEGSATRALADAQEAQTEFTIEKINQEKAQAQKDYTKEQSGAYTDWQKQSNQYGVNAEQRAMNGLQNSGYSESSQVAMYNQYQARITAARESYVKLQQDLSNQMTAARLANSSALAEIYAKAAEQRATMIIQFATQRTDLLTTMAAQKAAIRQQNRQNWLTVYNQLLNEMQLQEQADYHNDALALERDKFNWQKEQANKSVKISSVNDGASRTAKKKKQVDKLIKDQHAKIVNRENKGASERNYDNAIAYFNELIKSGANEDKVKNAIQMAVRDGAITQAQAKTLYSRFTPRGIRYN